MAKFEVGKMYHCHFTSDWDTIAWFQVVSRTDKSIVLRGDFCDGRGMTEKRKVIKEFEGSEYVMPLGTLSMAPMLRANHVCELNM